MGIVLPYKGDGPVAVIPRRAFFKQPVELEESKLLQPISFKSDRLPACKSAAINLKGF